MKRWTIITLTLVLFFAVAGIFVEAQAPKTDGADTSARVITDDEVNAVAKQLYCPVCENTPLDVCPTQACKDWRELIRQQLSDGWTEQQIKDYFVANFGPRVLANPPNKGFTSLVWLLPFAALLAGGAFLWRLLRQWQIQHRTNADTIETTEAPPEIPPSLLEQIEKDVKAQF